MHVSLLQPLLLTPIRVPGVCCCAKPSFTFSDISCEKLRSEQRAFVEERDWAQFHTPRSLALALVGEVGEVCELLQWRGDEAAQPGLPDWTPEERGRLGEELSDVLSYVLRLADVSNIDLPAAYLDKLAKNRAKYPADLVRGSSAKYTEYRQRGTLAGAESLTAASSESAKVPRGAQDSREWGTPAWVSAAYERAAAKVGMQPTTTKTPVAGGPPTPAAASKPSGPSVYQRTMSRVQDAAASAKEEGGTWAAQLEKIRARQAELATGGGAGGTIAEAKPSPRKAQSTDSSAGA